MNSLMQKLEKVLVATLLLLGANTASAVVDGITGTTFNLTAKVDYLTTGDGGSVIAWGYAADSGGAFPGVMQYPGPTLIVNQGDAVTINLTNPPVGPGTIPMPVSIVFPGQTGVTATGGNPGLLTNEAAPGQTVTYTFTASHPGTYLYHSGTRPDLQVEMGLVGAIIVRPAGFNEATNRTAYGHPGSAYDHEYLFLLTEMDAQVHDQVAAIMAVGGDPSTLDVSDFFPEYWFINGRAGPDTLSNAGIPWMPTQPYNAVPRMHPGEKLLMRVIGAGRDLHPFHHHGNNAWVIAQDGRLLESASGAGPDLAMSDYTIKTVPGSTYDAIFEWTGKGLGWDIYGTSSNGRDFVHTCNGKALGQPQDPGAPEYDPVTKEWCADHGKAIPVLLPQQQDLIFGGHWSGSPYLGHFAALPPGEGGLNLNAGYFFMWHSHTEKEIINFDVFPGGMMTMVIIEPPGVPIP